MIYEFAEYQSRAVRLAKQHLQRSEHVLCTGSPVVQLRSDFGQSRLRVPWKVRIAFHPSSCQISIRDSKNSHNLHEHRTATLACVEYSSRIGQACAIGEEIAVRRDL